jgi:hypothetical protein
MHTTLKDVLKKWFNEDRVKILPYGQATILPGDTILEHRSPHGQAVELWLCGENGRIRIYKTTCPEKLDTVLAKLLTPQEPKNNYIHLIKTNHEKVES